MLKRFFKAVAIVAVVLAAAAFWLTRPEKVDPSEFASLDGEAVAGETVYWASGCASCHAEEDDKTRTILSGGYRIVSDFGTFVSPNISPDPDHGIGQWSLTNRKSGENAVGQDGGQDVVSRTRQSMEGRPPRKLQMQAQGRVIQWGVFYALNEARFLTER